MEDGESVEVELRLALCSELEPESRAEPEVESELPELDLHATSSVSKSGRRFPCRVPA